MKLKNSLMFLSSLMLFVIVGCSSDDDNDDDGASLIDTPTEYSFESRFNSGESSVSYSGQVVRNLLINDIKTQMGADASAPIWVLMSLIKRFLTTCPEYETLLSPLLNLLSKEYSVGVSINEAPSSSLSSSELHPTMTKSISDERNIKLFFSFISFSPFCY